MSDQPSSKSFFLSFLGGLGAILIFVLIIFLAYLPNRPEPIDQAASEARQAKADESRAAGSAKISNYAVNPDGSIQIPVDAAMDLIAKEYQN